MQIYPYCTDIDHFRWANLNDTSFLEINKLQTLNSRTKKLLS